MRNVARTWRGGVVRGGVFGPRVAAVAAVLGVCGALSGAVAPQNEGDVPEAFRDAEHLLTVLETGDEGIRTLRAQVQLDSDFGPIEGNEKQRREGTLYFSTGEAEAEADEPAATRAFRVDFTRLKLPTGEEGKWVLRPEAKSYVFDGRTLLELMHEQEFAFVRHIAGPEEQVDPLAIGEGPFPIPIGQKKDEILRRFDAELLGPGEGLEGVVPPLLEGTVQLRLVPKPGFEEARDFADVRIWYARHDADGDGKADFLLPRQAVTLKPDGASAVAKLSPVGLEVNGELPAGLFSTDVPEGWERQVDDLRRDPGAVEEAE